MGSGGPYITKAEIVSFWQNIKTDLTEAMVSDFIFNAATQMINERSDTDWEIFDGEIETDGRGDGYIQCPKVPIVLLRGITIVHRDETEEELVVSGSSRQVEYNAQTGIIQRIDGLQPDITRDPDPGPLFPSGLSNIVVDGKFGKDADSSAYGNILALLQTLLVGRTLGFMFPSDFKAVDLIQEKIGEYEYRVGDMQYSKDLLNQKRTLDGYIELLFEMLPKEDGMVVEGI